MLTHYRKENRKIAMGLLSFHKKLTGKTSLLKEIDTYESEDDYELFSLRQRFNQHSRDYWYLLGNERSADHP